MDAKAFHTKHVEHWERESRSSERRAVHESWFRADTADAFRHARMYEAVRCMDNRSDLSWVEPRDTLIDPVRPNIRDLVRIFMAKVLNRVAPRLAPKFRPIRRYAVSGGGGYEEMGNYVYNLSAREIEKVALGSNLPGVAFKGLGDHYVEGVEFVGLNSQMGRDVQLAIRREEQHFEIGAGSTTLLMAVIFKQTPDVRTIERLQAADWLYLPLSRNPHIGATAAT